MSPFSFYFQGSHVGFILGLVLILAIGIWSISSKWELIKAIKGKYKTIAMVAALVLWTGSFINIGHTQNSLNRQQFDSMAGKLATPESVRVEVKTASPASVKEAAAATRLKIEQESK